MGGDSSHHSSSNQEAVVAGPMPDRKRKASKRVESKSPSRKKSSNVAAVSNIQMLDHKQSHINLLGKRFKIEDEMLGFGSFGRTYLGKDVKKNK